MIITKLKTYSLIPYWFFKSWRASVINKKSLKDPERYSEDYKWNYVVKRAQKTLKGLSIDLEVIGYDNLPKNSAILAPNHQSWLDSVAIIAALAKQTQETGVKHKVGRFLAKKESAKSRKTRGWLKLSRTFLIDRNNPRQSLKTINEMADRIREFGEYAIIFPEGTRTKDGKLQEFKAGAFRMAKKEFMPIIPVTINNTQKASSLKRKKIKIQVIFGKVIKPMTFISQPTEKIAERVKNKVQENYKEFKPNKNKFDKKV